MRKRLTLNLIVLLLVSLLFSASILIISAAACRKTPNHENEEEREVIIKVLQELSSEISELPNEAFENQKCARYQRKVLCHKVNVVIGQVEVGAYEGALNKLENDVKGKIERWIRHCWQSRLIEKVEYIRELLERILCRDRKPPIILGVLRFPETPNYDEPVTVVAHVIDKESGVKSVILSYSTDLISWINVNTDLVGGLYVAEVPPLPYNTTVSYRIYAYDWACNLATSKAYSYMVIDSYPPVISYIERVPACPNYEETVTVFANVTEPPDASGVKNVTLWYSTNDEWQPIEMMLEDELYTGIIPAFPYGTVVKYRIQAFDYAENWVTSGVYSYTVKAPPNLPPIAKFTESAETVFTNETISFNATESYDPDGYIVSYFWDFGDGTNATGILVEHAYADDGAYAVTLTVTDDDGATDIVSSTKYVKNRPPVASFTESAKTVYVNEVITFDASESHDPDGVIVIYFWEFGDGTNATGVTVDHAYTEDGIYTVVLAVIDDDGSMATATSVKTVSNRPPVASFTESATAVLTGEVIHFDASGSYDPDGSIICYVWDFGDGTSAAGVTANHAYEDNGVYTVTLTVIDDDGTTASTSAAKTVSNRSPVASFTENATTVKKGEVINFDASESYDPDGSIVDYFWNFGDGTNATGKTVNHAYAKDGNYTVTLTVTDNDGTSSSESAKKTVKTPAGWPLALLAAIGLGIAALTATLLYALYRRRKRGAASSPASSPGSKPVVTLYVPTKVLAGYD